MGQKVNPIGFRTGISRDWMSVWYADRSSFAENAVEDKKIRDYLRKRLARAGLKSIRIEGSISSMTVILTVSRPG